MSARSYYSLLVFAVAFLASCSEIQRPQPEPFFAETTPPAKQEFRWSNGKMPKSFDPASAAAAPETDVVRALFEGLTELDPRTLEVVPAAAEKWSASDDQRTWTFQLRKNARWSNGKRVTANDFVTSWKRLLSLGEKTAHRELFQNIIGFRAAKPVPNVELPDAVDTPPASPEALPVTNANTSSTQTLPVQPPPKAPDKIAEKLGVEAIDDQTLKVSLIAPDEDFPALAADPIFRPVYGDGKAVGEGQLDNGVITNGPFRVTLVDKNGISLERSETYWNKAAVQLEHIRFVQKENAESALDAYKKGEIDALTNADLEPLALKLLAPYEDFRQTTFSAVNLYKFDDTRPPFNDRRIREALAIAIDRERLANTELEGTADAAGTFLAAGQAGEKLAFDPVRAKKLLETIGFPNGEGFAPIKLLINRNNTQMRVARAVAKMWKQHLNLDTEITVKEATEIDAAEAAHEYDIVRRGVVLPTTDEMVSLSAIFGQPKNREQGGTQLKETPHDPEKSGPSETVVEEMPPANDGVSLFTEEDALFELRAIPLYFPRSYSLVKPYVRGFDTNALGAVYLPGVSIESDWQPKASKRAS